MNAIGNSNRPVFINDKGVPQECNENPKNAALVGTDANGALASRSLGFLLENSGGVIKVKNNIPDSQIPTAGSGNVLPVGIDANRQLVPAPHEGGGSSILDIYPIGSVYISIDYSFNPNVSFGGTWIRFGEGRCLWGANIDNSNLGNEIAPGLPTPSVSTTGGSVSAVESVPQMGILNETEGNIYYVGAPASAKNLSVSGISSSVLGDAIYGKSRTVQPPAIAVIFWRRVDPNDIYTVRFEDYDGTLIATENAIIGTSFSSISGSHTGLEHNNLTFKEWNTFGVDTIVSDMTVRAVYEYSVTFSIDSTTKYGHIVVDGTPLNSGTNYNSVTKTLDTSTDHTISVNVNADTTTDVYAFDEWSDGVTESTRIITVADVISGLDSLTAKFKTTKKLKITLYAETTTTSNTIVTYVNVLVNGERLVDNNNTRTFRPGDTVTIEILDGIDSTNYFEFLNWTDGSTDKVRTFTVPLDNQETSRTYRALVAKAYKFTLMTNDGTYVTTDPETEVSTLPDGIFQIEENKFYTYHRTGKTQPPDPIRDGHEFVGWYTNSALTTVYNWNASVTAAKTLYAKWNQVSS